MFVFLVIILCSVFFFFMKKHYSYWEARGVPGPKPTYFIGNIASFLFEDKSFVEIYADIYREFEGYPFVGIFRLFTPVLIVREPELIRDMAIKNFNSFQDNDVNLEKETDYVFGRDIFFLKGSEWKSKRARLTSCFSSGKMKSMYPMFQETSRKMVHYLNTKHSTEDNVLELRDLCELYTTDNVAASIFGLEGNCFNEKLSMFRQLSRDYPAPGVWKYIRSTIVFCLPTLDKIIKLRLCSHEIEKQILHIINETMAQRRKDNQVRNDILESLRNVLRNSNTFEEEKDIVSVAANFFSNGFELSANVLSFVIFELASNPECQTKLREEIEECEATHGELSYDVVQNMPYLNACVNETLRRNPSFGKIVKTCTKHYTYTCANPEYKNLTLSVEPGTSVVFPIFGMQNDEKFFKSADKFVPERFLDTPEFNKYSYLPFGEGPRTCIGMRFGLTQIRQGLVQLIKNFEFKVNSRTQLPLRFKKWNEVITPIGGLWVDFQPVN